MTKTTKTEKELTKANLKLAAELVEARKDRDDAITCSVALSGDLLATNRELENVIEGYRACDDVWKRENHVQQQQIAQLQSNLGTFRDRFKARVNEMNMEARFWKLSIKDLVET